MNDETVFHDPFIRNDSYEVERYDGALFNMLGNGLIKNNKTGLGSQADSITNNFISGVRILSEYELRALYRSNWVISRIVDIPPEDMTSSGFNINITDGDFDDVSPILNKYKNITANVSSPYDDEETADDAFQLAYKWARLFGQAYIVVRVNNGEDLSQPIRKVRSIEGLSVIDRYGLIPDESTFNINNPDYYRLVLNTDKYDIKYNEKIHKSRVLIFTGKLIPDVDKSGNRGNNDSIIQQLWEVFNRHYSVKGSISKAVNSFSLMTMAISNLSQLISSGRKGAITDHIKEVSAAMSVYGIMLTDSDIEKPMLMDRRFGGVAENVQHVIDELTAATGLPYYKIWGTVGKAALTDSAGPEQQAYSDQNFSRQKNKFYKNHRRLIKMIFDSEIGYIPQDWDIEYNPIIKENPKLKAETDHIISTTYNVYKMMGVVTPEEVAIALSSKQPIESVIDVNKFDEFGQLILPEIEDDVPDNKNIKDKKKIEPKKEEKDNPQERKDSIVQDGDYYLVKIDGKTLGRHESKEAAIAQAAMIELGNIQASLGTSDALETLDIKDQLLDDTEWESLALVTPQDQQNQITGVVG